MSKFKRKKLDLLYDSIIVSLYADYLETPDGRTVKYDYVKHKKGGGAGILLIDENEYTYLVKQYRNAIDDMSIEFPAGAYDNPGESGEVCALREAEEETGFIPKKLYHVANTVSCIGVMDEKTDVYIGTDLVPGKKRYDENEFIELLHVHIDEAVDMIYEGKIVDSKTVIAILGYKDMKSRGIIG